MFKVLEVKSADELEKWDKFHQANKGSYFQSLPYYKLCKSISHISPGLIAVYEDDIIMGGILYAILEESAGLKRLFSKRAIIIGGPLFKYDRAPFDWLHELLLKLNNSLAKKAIYTEFRNLFDLSEEKRIFRKHGFRFMKYLSIKVELLSWEETKKRISKSKKRQINKSLNSGAEIIVADNTKQIEDFYRILRDLYRKKVKKPLPPFEFFKQAFNQGLRDNSIVYLLIRFNGKIIGGIMCPVYNDIIYEWFVCGLDNEYKNQYPSVLATWAAIEYGMKNNCRIFDFLGAGKPDRDYGVREFKTKFGGSPVNHGRFKRINKRISYAVGFVGLKILSILKLR